MPPVRIVSLEDTYNRLTGVTDPLNHTTGIGYDAAGNLMSIQGPILSIPATTFGYNTAGQVTSVTNPLSKTWQFGYEYGDLNTVTDPLQRTTTRVTDYAGRLGMMENALGQRTHFEYDALNRLRKVTDPLTSKTEFTYDPNGNLLSVKDARSGTTSYVYDNMDQLQARTDPLTKPEDYVYDFGGNLTRFTDRKRQVTNFAYDPFGRLETTTYADSSTTTNTYDDANRLTQVVDSISGTVTLTWDDFDRLTREVTPQGTVDYTYDDAGRRATMTVAGQPVVNYTYDNADRLTGITQGSSTVTFEYDNADRRTKTTLPNGVSMEYFYDHAGQLTRIDYKQGTTLIGDLTYEYDAAGNRIAMGGSFGRTGLPQPLASAVYDAANRLTQWGGTTLSYDDNGNLTSDATNSYTWSARNQLASMTGASFQYDAFGRRKSKTIGGASTQFLYDGVNVVQELSGTTANLLTGLGVDEMFTRTDSAGAGHYLTDGLGSTLALTDPTGAVQTRYTYEPYGKVSVSGTSSANPFQYTGRENDGTGLYYYRARYYHPVLQRFISEDPIEFEAGDPNFYGYVFNDPIGAYDPDGLSIAGKIFKQTVKGAWRLIRNKTAQQQLAKKCDLNYATPSGGRRALRAMKKLSPGETVKGHTKDVTAREYGPHVQTSPNPKRNHLFFGRELYSITGPLTLSYYAEGRGWWTETASALADLFNPLSIPNDIVEVADELNGIAHEVLPFSGRK